MKPSKLFTPVTIGAMEVRNRFMRSATAERLADGRGAPLPRLSAMLEDLARGGVGLIVTGHMYVDPGGLCHPEMTGAHDDSLVDGLALLAAAAHRQGARIAAQLNHGGRACDPAMVARPVAPSAVPGKEGGEPPAVLSEEGIAGIVGAFRAAARRVKAAGFDAVQVHGAHGYLVSQFLSPLANRRTDGYGGDLAGRARFLREVVEAVRAEVGEGFPVLVKLGVTDNLEGGLTAEEGARVASWLAAWGADAVETSTGGRGAMATRVTRPEREAYLVDLARAVHRTTDLPVLLVGGLRTLPVMEQALEAGLAMVSMSRPLIREPDLVARIERGETRGATCVSCNRCWPRETGEGVSCKRE